MGCEKKWISLNVGGTIYTTTRSTLGKKAPASSPLYRVSSRSTKIDWDRDENGAYLIDRDPTYFQPILNYLRTGQLIISKQIPDEAILVEAEYYDLPELARLIKQRIMIRNFCSNFDQSSRLSQMPAPEALFKNPVIEQSKHQQQSMGQFPQVKHPPIQPVESPNKVKLDLLFQKEELLTSYVNNVLSIK